MTDTEHALVRAAPTRRESLERAQVLLQSFLRARGGGLGLLRPEELEPLRRLLEQRAYLEPIPRIVLVGEFKSGKSTLANALLEGQYAAVDVLEMTSWIARYVPSDEPFCRVTYRNGTDFGMDPDDFRRRCEGRRFSAEELENTALVEVGTGKRAPCYAIIDCPGLGSITRANEERLLRALEDADLMVWTVSVDAIGGLRESALIRKLDEQGMPRVVALTKCDELGSDAELEELTQYLMDQYGVRREDLFPTAALPALKAALAGRPAAPDTGIPRLNEFLGREVWIRHEELRAQARLAHEQRVIDQVIDLLQYLDEQLERALRAFERFRTITDSAREAVQAEVEILCEQLVRQRMFGHRKPDLARRLEELMKGLGGGLPPQEHIEAVFSDVLGPRYMDRFWAEVQRSTFAAAAKAWKSRLSDAKIELRDVEALFSTGIWTGTGTGLALPAIRRRIDQVADETFQTALAAGVGIAALATAYFAWLGPAAASVTIGAAATGIGIPVAALGIAVAYGLKLWKRQKAEEALGEQVEGALQQYIEDFIDRAVRPGFFPKLEELNRRIAAGIVDGLRENIDKRLPSGDLETLHREVTELKLALAGP